MKDEVGRRLDAVFAEVAELDYADMERLLRAVQKRIAAEETAELLQRLTRKTRSDFLLSPRAAE